MSVERRRGFTLWLTGLSGAGKTTLAKAVQQTLQAAGRPVEILDGDEVRHALGGDLGYGYDGRVLNMRRIGYLAQLLSRNGVAVIVAAMSPYRAVREEIRRGHITPFVEAFVDCSLDELVRRDTKGLYAKARDGKIGNMIGLSDPYEPSPQPDLHLHTDVMSEAACVEAIMTALGERALLVPRPRGL